MPKNLKVDNLRIAAVQDGDIQFQVRSGTKRYRFSFNAERYMHFIREAQELLAPLVDDGKVVRLPRH